MKIRAALLSSVLAVGLVASASDAAAPCNLITDPAGDAEIVSNDDALDILSADLASNSKEIVAVIRLAKVKKTSDQSPLGIALSIQFNAPGFDKPLYLSAVSSATAADSLTFGYKDGNRLIKVGDALGRYDADKNEVYISTFTKGFSAQAKLAPGDKLTNVTALAAAVYGSPAAATLQVPVDDAIASKAYTAGAESCILKK